MSCKSNAFAQTTDSFALYFDAFAWMGNTKNALALHLECIWNAFASNSDAFASNSDAFALHMDFMCISFGVRVFAVCFLAMYHPTADDDLIVAVWLCFRDTIIPQP